MYKLLLITKYLTRKLAPLFAAVAVLLCTAMVIIVISVMGGFLDTLRSKLETMTADVTVSAGSLSGFARYDELARMLEDRPEVDAAAPSLSGFALIQLAERNIPVQVSGIRPEQFSRVVDFKESLHWTARDLVGNFEESVDALRVEGEAMPPDLAEMVDRKREELATLDLQAAGMTFQPPAGFGLDDSPLQGIVIGIAVNPYNTRDETGDYRIDTAAVGQAAVLTVVPITEGGTLREPSSRKFVVVNESKSGHYEFDRLRVFIAFDTLQQMLRMDEAPQVDLETGELTGRTVPSRATEVLIDLAPGVPLEAGRDAVSAVLRDFREQFPDDGRYLFVDDWEQQNSTLLGAGRQ